MLFLTSQVRRIVDLLERAAAGSQVAAVEQADVLEDVTAPRRNSDVTAWVNAIYGCNERCTYCVVPNTRGQEQSREADAIRVRLRASCPRFNTRVTLCSLLFIAVGVVICIEACRYVRHTRRQD
jgi:tRNA-2-methylthio-N6-dimethylallyladenosine synthase